MLLATRPPARVFRHLLTITLVLATAVGLLGSAAAAEAAPAYHWQMVAEITFPTTTRVSFGDTYHACRSGCSRKHKATDLMGRKMWPLYAAVDGEICRLDTGAEDSYGRHITVCGDDGRRYRYLHLNNDTPGTDDDKAGLEHVYGPYIREGVRVVAGQHIAYMGDSGNAEGTAAHLHLDIFDDRVKDPYGDNRINPYPSLRAALAAGRTSDGGPYYAKPTRRVAGPDRIGTSVALSADGYRRSQWVVIAPGNDAAETIVAGPLARALGGPVLTTAKNRLDARVMKEIRRLGSTDAYVIGEVSKEVLAGVRKAGIAGGRIHHVVGRDRFDTAALVAEEVWQRLDAQGVDGQTSARSVPGPTADLAAAHEQQVTLSVSDRPDRSDARALDGASLSGDAFVFVGGVADHEARSVAFWVDADPREDDPRHVENHEPWDLAGTGGEHGGASPWDTSRVDDGEHVAAAVVSWEDGTHGVAVARFTVDNKRGADRPDDGDIPTKPRPDDGGGDSPADRPAPGTPPDQAGAPRTALVALGSHPNATRAWPDALMASYYGSVIGAPVLLVAHNQMPVQTARALETASTAVIFGGDGAIRPDLAREVTKRTQRVRRLAGTSRFSTATAAVDDLLHRGLVSADTVWTAAAHNWPDAVTAGPVVAKQEALFLLVDGRARGGDGDVDTWLAGRRDRVDRARVVGGRGVVTRKALVALSRRIT